MKKEIERRVDLTRQLSKEELEVAVRQESELFRLFYVWLAEHMAPAFFEEFTQSQLMTIAHNLVGFDLQGKFIQIHFKENSIVICEESPDVDLRILKNFSYCGVQSYQTFVSDEPPPIKGVKSRIRIAVLHITQRKEGSVHEEKLSDSVQQEVYQDLVKLNPNLTKEEFQEILDSVNSAFLRVLTKDRLVLILNMLIRAQTRDHLQYEVRENEDWKKPKKNVPSLQIVFAWKNTQKYNFLYKMAKLIFRHRLEIKRVNAAYVEQKGSSDSILLMSLAIHGQENKAAWEVTDVKDFLRELATLKYFEEGDKIETTFIDSGILRGNLGNLLRVLANMAHQLLLHADANLYSMENIIEGICRHPELTQILCNAFEAKFNPDSVDLGRFEKEKAIYIKSVNKIDTGNLTIDNRRKNILMQMIHIVEHTLKTNFYRNNKSSIACRFDPVLLDTVPYDRKEKFPELPYAIFFLKGRGFIGFHIRFKDLSRGGVRTVFPGRVEQANWERNNIFSECYNLSYTQQKKNKDIPEGGSKGVIFIDALEELRLESYIYEKELESAGVEESEIKEKITAYQRQQKLIYLYQSQRAYIYSLMTLINCDEDGTIKAKDIVDYYKKPEYLYLGPDENMHNVMIDWIADFSVKIGYKPGSAFISSKPLHGINHKEYGVTSLGVNVYMHKMLEYLDINPAKDSFTVKISGGPDGDVAGNQIYNLYKFYPNTAKVVAITDVSGTISDPEGLDLTELVKLFKNEEPINRYPAEKLSEGGFLLDLQNKRDQTAYQQQTLCYRKQEGKLIKDWLLGNESHYLFSHNLHQTYADIFIPAGGRPRTLSDSNWTDYLDPMGRPTSRAIVEAANLYLTQEARELLEERGALIIKDSSANKGGVICSSLEVLSGLLLSEKEFVETKPKLMKDILEFIEEKAGAEAELLLKTHAKTKKHLTEISESISLRINTYMYQILDYLVPIELPKDLNNHLMQCIVKYIPSFFRERYEDRILTNIPAIHLKAIIACYIASKIVYQKGLFWSPSIVDVLPLIIHGIDEIP